MAALHTGQHWGVNPRTRASAQRTVVATAVAVAVVAGALALWKLRFLLALLFLAMILAAAMRPGVEALARRGVPRPIGVTLYYVALAGLIALVLWLVVPTAIDQVQAAIGKVPSGRADLHRQAQDSSGVGHEILTSVDRWLRKAPTAASLLHPALDVGRKALETIVGILFVLASAAYWIFERDRAQRVVVSFLPHGKRQVVCATWNLVDLKLGAYVRGSLLLILFVSLALSASFWAVGLPYWLLLGIFAGLVEIIPVIGPLAAGVLAIGVGLTVSVQTAALAAVAVYSIRVFQDYVVNPRVLGHAVGLTPLAVLVGVAAVGLLFGGAYVPLATPFLAVVATIMDVMVRGKDPAREPVPAVIFPVQETEVVDDGKHARPRGSAARTRRS
jgi:predicted PurR-regulated permease PerM